VTPCTSTLKRLAALGAAFALSLAVLALSVSPAPAAPSLTQSQRATTVFDRFGAAPASVAAGTPGRLILNGRYRTAATTTLVGSSTASTVLGWGLLAAVVGGIALLAREARSRRGPQLVLISSRVPTPGQPEIHEREQRRKAA
jgi:hypothetical protein